MLICLQCKTPIKISEIKFTKFWRTGSLFIFMIVITWYFSKFQRAHNLLQYSEPNDFMQVLLFSSFILHCMLIAGAIIGFLIGLCIIFSRKINGKVLIGKNKYLDYLLPMKKYHCGCCGLQALYGVEWGYGEEKGVIP